MNLDHGICTKCQMKDQDPGSAHFYSAQNRMDFGEVPAELPQLSQVEEMLIAKVHVDAEIRQHRGMQHRYKGHICYLLRDVGKVYRVLVLLPRNLAIILIAPSNERLRNVLVIDFRVRRPAISMWLRYLTLHHPAYTNDAVQIPDEHLLQLPGGGNVINNITTRLKVDETIAGVEDNITDDALFAAVNQYEKSAVPDLVADRTEIERRWRRSSPCRLACYAYRRVQRDRLSVVFGLSNSVS
ncbi:hypothetical protein M426DRAFT_15391 [Hypoxylon sp. CI-4A]|nr:hypothetical protein M426DRAFT_15391 [Hypoxylon sp. CI-4A]